MEEGKLPVKPVEDEHCFNVASLKMEEGSVTDKSLEPKDRYNLAYLIHIMLGAGTLLPWNALITAVDYFGYLYPEQHVSKVFTMAYMGSSFPVFVVLVGWSNWRRRSAVRLKMNLGFSLFVVSLLTIPIMDWSCRHGERRWGGAYRVTVVAVGLCGVGDGLIGGSLIGAAGELPKRYMQAVFVGTASSGVLLSLLRIITKASLPQTPEGLRTSTHLYFIVSILILQGCMVFYNILDKLPVMQQFIQKKTQVSSTASPIILSNNAQGLEQLKFWDILKKIKWLACGIFIIYVVTLSIFPGFISENVTSKLLGDWYPLLLITAYNISDLAGKCTTAAYTPKSATNITVACAARVVFYPLFAACLHGPRFFQTEVPVIVLTSGLGITNGYLTSALMILAPKSVPSEEAETAGVVMALFLAIGLAGGSVLGWFWVI